MNGLGESLSIFSKISRIPVSFNLSNVTSMLFGSHFVGYRIIFFCFQKQALKLNLVSAGSDSTTMRHVTTACLMVRCVAWIYCLCNKTIACKISY